MPALAGLPDPIQCIFHLYMHMHAWLCVRACARVYVRACLLYMCLSDCRHSHSRFFVKVDKEFKGPRTEEQLKEGLERSEGTKEERVKVLREHLEQLVKEETSAKEREEQPSEIVEAAEEKPTVDVAKEGLAIDALKAFLAAN